MVELFSEIGSVQCWEELMVKQSERWEKIR